MAARDVGALGYVEKPRLAIDLLHAVREARAGRPCFSRFRLGPGARRPD